MEKLGTQNISKKEIEERGIKIVSKAMLKHGKHFERAMIRLRLEVMKDFVAINFVLKAIIAADKEIKEEELLIKRFGWIMKID